MDYLLRIQQKIVPRIRPSDDEVKRGHHMFLQIQESIQQVADKKKIEIAFIELEGSFGRKQTQLHNWRELDVFVGLPVSILTRQAEPEKPSKNEVRKLFNKLVRDVALEAANVAGCDITQIAFAEHPYITAYYDEFKIDIVFCFDLPSKFIREYGPITAVDRTPHHSRFVDDHLTKIQRDDVRLLKAFFHSAFVYGDSSPIGRSGFTGFSIEMIIYHSQNFINALNYLKTHPLPPLDYFKRSNVELRQRFDKDHFIIVDPTDPNRNVASSISERATRFVKTQVEQLLQKPSTKFFKMKPIPVLSISEMEQLKTNYLVVEFDDQTGWHYTKTRDKIYRFFTKLQKFLMHEPTSEPRFGKVIFEEVFKEKHYAVALWIEKPKINEKYLRIGPPSHMKQAIKRFKEKHPKAIFRDGRYQTEITRSFISAEQAIKHFLNENKISPKLQLLDISPTGKTRLGNQALWILKEAVIPYLNH